MKDESQPEEESSPEQEMLKKVSEAASIAPKLDDFDARLKELEEKAGKATGRYRNVQKEESRKIASDSEASRGLGFGLSIAYTIIGLPLLGVLVGTWLDNHYHAHFWTALLLLVGGAGGMIYTIGALNKANSK